MLSQVISIHRTNNSLPNTTLRLLSVLCFSFCLFTSDLYASNQFRHPNLKTYKHDKRQSLVELQDAVNWRLNTLSSDINSYFQHIQAHYKALKRGDRGYGYMNKKQLLRYTRNLKQDILNEAPEVEAFIKKQVRSYKREFTREAPVGHNPNFAKVDGFQASALERLETFENNALGRANRYMEKLKNL